MWKVYGIMFLVVVVIIFWVRGIDNMMKNHPDYKGEDWLNWGDNNDDFKKEDEEEKNRNYESDTFVRYTQQTQTNNR